MKKDSGRSFDSAAVFFAVWGGWRVRKGGESKAGAKDLGKFLDIIAGVFFFPEGTVDFFDRRMVPYEGDPADGGIEPDLLSDHIDRQIALAGYNFQACFLHGVGKEEVALEADDGLVIVLLFLLAVLVDD